MIEYTKIKRKKIYEQVAEALHEKIRTSLTAERPTLKFSASISTASSLSSGFNRPGCV